ncbi:MAG TPA: NADAR family protein [Candidatus Paceibacterota bacterium]|nr:NADAR family protein [Candidatus Paceibacterota bacterium]
MRETETHIYFWTNWMSNWTPSNLKIYYDGELFTNSEQIFMYIKAKFFGDEDKAKEIVKLGSNPAIAKKLGREVSGYDEEAWSTSRFDAMYAAVKAKFESDRVLSKQLMETDTKTLVEASPVDIIWGVGIHEKDDAILDENNWKGQNLLGKVLMKVRTELQAKNGYMVSPQKLKEMEIKRKEKEEKRNKLEEVKRKEQYNTQEEKEFKEKINKKD